ncbi:lipid A biosynthesis acyltransferase [Pseudorhodoferax sp. Leaf267]|uniref:LpxL/LpxP family acyltransferase n=1 Tax=Pseudorhodoferax sp. Leaf267 TaxID=1736316 RepID=UPI0006FFF7E3|nr:lipid A biosynthesis acyltransferase [Pseudorhodoferax sp. Leaf267]KQP23231.1 lipid A biosynthesis acyltransferase [Pseudorhodoferax sp. Leaf267]
MLARVAIVLMRLLAPLPLPLVRGLGWLLAQLLYRLVGSRRRIALTNLALCFPDMPAAEREALARRSFVVFLQAWLDRSWLWHGRPETTRRRLRMTGELAQFDGQSPVLIFAPHFVGLDAGATALSQQIPRQFATIYTPQSNLVIDAWVARGRQRFGNAKLYNRADGIKPVVAALRAGEPVYLLPDMDFGARDSVFVPFYGVPAATVPSLARFARLGRARVVPVVTRMTRQGYEVQVLPAWEQFPTDDAVADTARMNQRLQGYIDAMPAQYFWVHKRFKTRPPGAASVY